MNNTMDMFWTKELKASDTSAKLHCISFSANSIFLKGLSDVSSVDGRFTESNTGTHHSLRLICL